MANSSFELSNIDGSNGFVIEGLNAYERLGNAVSNGGDVNGDGIDDLIIGVPNAGEILSSDYGYKYSSANGRVYVIFGDSDGFATELDLNSLDGSNGFAIDGNDRGDRLGSGVSNAGDLNGDGIDDLIIGAPDADSTGESYVIFGGNNVGSNGSIETSSLDGTNGFVIKGIVSGDRAGFSVSNAGDINGDGFDDLIIGAPDAEGIPTDGPYDHYNINNGESYVVFGGTEISSDGTFELSSLDGSNGFILNGVDGSNRFASFEESFQEVDRFGSSVSNAGDINGDGFEDIIIAAPGLNYYGSQGGNSEIYVVFGGSDVGASGAIAADTLNGTNGFVVDEIDFARSVSSAGDINGDGFNDIIVGSAFSYYYGRGPVFVGTSYVVFGGSEVGDSGVIVPDALDGSNGFILESEESGDLLGYSVSGVGDVNGDGFEDLLIGAPKAGRYYYTDEAGYTNLFITYAGPGASFIVFGDSEIGSDGTVAVDASDSSRNIILAGSDNGDDTGFAVSGAGDVNDDGIEDLIVGTPSAGNPISRNNRTYGDRRGESYIVFGNAAPQLDLNGKESGIDFTTTFTSSPVSIVAGNNLSLSDSNSNTLSQATVAIANLLDSKNELLAADTTGTNIAAEYDAATGKLSLTGEDSLANYRQVLNTLTYNNTAEVVDTSDRIIEFTVNDGAAFNNTSSVATTTIAIDTILSGFGGQKNFTVNPGDGEITIKNFGGVGTGINPSAGVIEEVDTLKFIGSQLTVDNLILTQNDNDLVISFEGVADTKVILSDFDLELLDNLPSSIGNLLFDGQSEIVDSFDVFDAERVRGRVFNRDKVTFLNDLNNTLQGLNNSDDAIDGREGDDILLGRSGDDLLRGNGGNDLLLDGGAGKDRLDGGLGDDGLFGGAGADEFVLRRSEGTDRIFDFEVGFDRLVLAGGLEFEELEITGRNGQTEISLSETEEVLATLIGVNVDNLTMSDFLN